MKNFKEEIEAMKAQIAALENNLTDKSSEIVTPEQSDIVVFTKEELINFATILMARTVQACKEAANNIELDPEYICDLSLGCNNQIEIHIDSSAIVGAVESEIDDVVEIDNDSVEAEVDDILHNMLLEAEVKNKLFP